VVGPFEHGNEPLGSRKGRELLNKLSNHSLLKKDSAPWREGGREGGR
jgi:hypothetical protein